jgi:hypothetical protein
METKKLNIRVLDSMIDGEDRLIRVALVSDKEDTYETVLVPEGCTSPIESVPVDYMHNRISTECNLESSKIEDIDIETATGEQIRVSALTATVRVPKTAKKWTRANSESALDTVPSLYDSVTRGQTRWGSVDFVPLEVIQYRDKSGNLIREVYPKWQLNFFSLLDTKPGQETSFFLNVRSIDTSQNQIKMKYTINQKVRFAQEVEVIKTESIEDKSIYTVRIGETELALDEQSIDLLSLVSEENKNKRVWLNSTVKRLSDGMLGVVTKCVDVSENGTKTKTATIKTVDGGEYTVDATTIEYIDYDECDCQWVYAETGDILMYFISLTNTTPTTRAGETKEEPNEFLAKLEEKVAQLEIENTRLMKLANAPIEKSKNSKNTRSSFDPTIGEGADTQTTESTDADPIDTMYQQVINRI